MDKDARIPTLIRKALSDDLIEVFDHNNKINFIHAFDVANAAFLSYLKKVGGTFNIASKDTVSILELANEIIKINKKGTILPKNISNNPICRFDLNFNKAAKNIKFSPLINISDGIFLMTKNNTIKYDLGKFYYQE